MKRASIFALALAFLTGGAAAQTSSPDDRLLRSRAVEAAIWGMPAVNYDLMLQEMLTRTPGKVNQVIYWGRPLDWKNQTLTPNPDTLYFMAFLNTKDVGPIVIDVPPADADGSLKAAAFVGAPALEELRPELILELLLWIWASNSSISSGTRRPAGRWDLFVAGTIPPDFGPPGTTSVGTIRGD